MCPKYLSRCTNTNKQPYRLNAANESAIDLLVQDGFKTMHTVLLVLNVIIILLVDIFHPHGCWS